MSIMLYGTYDSTDAAEFAAARLKRNVRGIRIAGISKRVLPDHSEETVLFAYPTYNNLFTSNGLSGQFSTIPYLTQSMRDPDFEPAQRKDVSLRVEADSEQAASQAELILRSSGGREIRKVRDRR